MLESSIEKVFFETSVSSDIIPDSTLDGWIFFLRELPQKPILGDHALASGSPRSELLLATLLARRYVIRRDRQDYDEAKSRGEAAAHFEEEDDRICQYLNQMDQASSSLGFESTDTSSSFHPGSLLVTSTSGSISSDFGIRSSQAPEPVTTRNLLSTYTHQPPTSFTFSQLLNELLDAFPWKHMSIASENPYVSVSVAEGDTLASVVKFALDKLHDGPDLHDYACGCLVLAYSHYILYRRSGNRCDFEEAFDYSSTASYLLVGLGRPLSALTDCQEWKLAYGIPRNYAMHFFEDFTSLTRTWNVFELFELFRSSMPVVGSFPVYPLDVILSWYNSGDYLTTINTYISLAAQPAIQTQIKIMGQRLVTEQPVPLVDFAMIHGILSQFTSHGFDSRGAKQIIDTVKEQQSVSDDTSASVLSLEILARIHVLRCTFFGWDNRAKTDEYFAERYFREAISSSCHPTQSVLLSIDFVRTFWIPRFTARGSRELDELTTALVLLSAAVCDIDETDQLFPDMALVLAQTYMHSLIWTHEKDHLTKAIFWYQKYAAIAGPRAELVALDPEKRTYSLPGKKRSEELGWHLLLYVGLLYTISWAREALQQNRSECLEGFRILSSLTSNPIWLGNSAEDKQLPLRTIRTIGPSAVAAALRFDPEHPHVAVEYLERNRSITYRHLLQLNQKQGNALASVQPELARMLDRYSYGLRQLSVGALGDKWYDWSGLPGKVDIFKRGTEYKELLKKIRTKTGVEDVLLPSSYKKLATASQGGPVILLSSDEVTKATYALIIMDPEGEPIPLLFPDVSYEDIRRRVGALAQLLKSCNVLRRRQQLPDGRAGQPSTWRPDKNSKGFEAILRWTWRKIVEPVLDILEGKGISSGRIWWCPAGDLIHLPLHAAMPLDCPYIPSYTYTLESLVNARSQVSIAKKPNSGPLRMLAVGLSAYPDRPSLSLPSVKQEIKGISEVVGAINGHYEKPLVELVTIEDAEARVNPTLNAMKSSDIVHLACHGCQDGIQPLNSHLILSDGVLRLREILSAELSNAKFGFLSACQTATGDIELANESFHLAGGLLAAGLKGAIGTLWSIADEDAPEVAREVYKATVTRDGMDLGKAAEGLHIVVKKMREKNLPPHRWIPFIHVGI